MFMIVAFCIRAAYLIPMPRWLDIQKSWIYLWKQTLTVILILMSSAEMIDAIFVCEYTFQKVRPRCACLAATAVVAAARSAQAAFGLAGLPLPGSNHQNLTSASGAV